MPFLSGRSETNPKPDASQVATISIDEQFYLGTNRLNATACRPRQPCATGNLGNNASISVNPRTAYCPGRGPKRRPIIGLNPSVLSNQRESPTACFEIRNNEKRSKLALVRMPRKFLYWWALAKVIKSEYCCDESPRQRKANLRKL